jgi:hypothetical protein
MWVVNKTLIDLKSSRSNMGSKELYQLLGYALLDQDREYKIKSVGIYFVRKGMLLKWKLPDFYKFLNPRIRSYTKFKDMFYTILHKRRSTIVDTIMKIRRKSKV